MNSSPLPDAPAGLTYRVGALVPGNDDLYHTTGCFEPNAPKRNLRHLKAVGVFVFDADLVDFTNLSKAQLHAMAPAQLLSLKEEHADVVIEALIHIVGEPPSKVVDSGFGAHLYYELTAFARGDDIQAVRGINGNIADAVNDYVGYKLLDHTNDTGTRLLRPVGSFNNKGTAPMEVELVEENDTRLDLQAIKAARPEWCVPKKLRPGNNDFLTTTPTELPPQVATAISDGRTSIGKAWNANTQDQSAKDFNIARVLVKEGLSLADIAAALYIRRTDPDHNAPFNGSHLEHYINFTLNKFTPEPSPGVMVLTSQTSVGIGQHYADELRDERKSDPYHRVIHYNEDVGVWEVVHDSRLYTEVTDLYQDALVRRRQGAEISTTEFELANLNGRLPEDVVKHVKHVLHDPKMGKPAGAHFLNGVLTTDGVLIPHSPDNNIFDSMARSFEYDPTATCPTWEAHLTRCGLEDDAQAFLGYYIGAALLGVAAHKQAKHPILDGTKDSGKSVTLDLINALFPEEARCSVEYQHMATRFGRAPLVGKMLNCVDDMSASEFKNTGRIKSILTGGAVNIDIKNQDEVYVELPLANFCSVNGLPPTQDFSPAFFKRFVVLPFYRTIPPEEQDRRINDKLLAERTGIITWAVRHYLDWKRNNPRGVVPVPKSVEHALEAWQEENNIVLSFLNDHFYILPIAEAKTELAANQRVNITGFKRALDHYAAMCGEELLSLADIKRRLRALGVAADLRTSGSGRFLNVAFKPTREKMILQHYKPYTPHLKAL